MDSCKIRLNILSKNSKKLIQTIYLNSDFCIDKGAFVNINNSRSYVTGKNKNKNVVDWDYGDLVVADFNFDNMDDFAIKKEVGGNGGPIYIYYIQKSDSTFRFDKFLTNNLNCFPDYFIKETKTLKSICRGCSVTDIVTIIKLDTLKNKWKLVSSREVDIKRKKW